MSVKARGSSTDSSGASSPAAPGAGPDASQAASGEGTSPGSAPAGEYVVVARRYRPQAFGELIGQEHVGRGLTGAILSHRVGHAYLFTGARGVGKTSAARILAKSLNCEQGPSPNPCNVCDACQRISSGDDVDVLEIDGASNRGIDEIRQLRQNVNIRPSRSRFKVYIIDEVHMLTREAFNALLKTLEEPPEHVKFVFCTTEPEKIPITILSRCQRYDFAGIQAGSIAARLAQIVRAEGVEAEPEALAVLARRAAGSMRDSQSLLEQLLAFGSRTIKVADVHQMLGTAGAQRLAEMARHLVERDAAGALADLDRALTEGVDVGQLLDQLLGYFRDVMATTIGCPAESLLHTTPDDQQEVAAAAKRLGLMTILAMMQILDHTISRLRFSTHGRTLAELALARIASLEDLDNLAELAGEIRSGAAALPAPVPTPSRGQQMPRVQSSGLQSASDQLGGAKKKAELSHPHRGPETFEAKRLEATNNGATSNGTTSNSSAANGASASDWPARQSASIPGSQNGNVHSSAEDDTPPAALSGQSAQALWNRALALVDDMTADHAKLAHEVALVGPDQLAVIFAAKYTFNKSACERGERFVKLEAALAQVAGRRIELKFSVVAHESPHALAPVRAISPRMRKAELEKQMRARPLVQQAMQLFGANEISLTENPECSKDSAI